MSVMTCGWPTTHQRTADSQLGRIASHRKSGLEGALDRRKTHIDVWKETWIDRYFDLPLWGRSILIGFLAALLGFALDELAHIFGYPWFVERLAENALEGAVITAVVFWLSRLREQRIVHRMREIGFLNHHIRNAMQAIALAATGIDDTGRRAVVIGSSVHRVIEALSKMNRKGDELNSRPSTTI